MSPMSRVRSPYGTWPMGHGPKRRERIFVGAPPSARPDPVMRKVVCIAIGTHMGYRTFSIPLWGGFLR